MGTRAITLCAAIALVASPAVAQADRENAPTSDTQEMGGGSGLVLAVLAVAAIIAGILIAAGGSDDGPLSA